MLEEPKENEPKVNRFPVLPDETYDILKWIAQIVLPAIGSLYYGIAGIWGLPYQAEVVGSIMAVDTFLGVLLGISTALYMKNR